MRWVGRDSRDEERKEEGSQSGVSIAGTSASSMDKFGLTLPVSVNENGNEESDDWCECVRG